MSTIDQDAWVYVAVPAADEPGELVGDDDVVIINKEQTERNDDEDVSASSGPKGRNLWMPLMMKHLDFAWLVIVFLIGALALTSFSVTLLFSSNELDPQVMPAHPQQAVISVTLSHQAPPPAAEPDTSSSSSRVFEPVLAVESEATGFKDNVLLPSVDKKASTVRRPRANSVPRNHSSKETPYGVVPEPVVISSNPSGMTSLNKEEKEPDKRKVQDDWVNTWTCDEDCWERIRMFKPASDFHGFKEMFQLDDDFKVQVDDSEASASCPLYINHEAVVDSDTVLALSVTQERLEGMLDMQPFTFVFYHESDCSDYQDMATEWSKFGHQAAALNLPMGIASVDCGTELNLCRARNITTFPAMRWYDHGRLLYTFNGNQFFRTAKRLLRFAKVEIDKAVANSSPQVVPASGVPELAAEEPAPALRQVSDTAEAVVTKKDEQQVSKSSDVSATKKALQSVRRNRVTPRSASIAGGGERAQESAAMVRITEDNFDRFVNKGLPIFLLFCDRSVPDCRETMPEWQEFAQQVKEQQLPMVVGFVDTGGKAMVCLGGECISSGPILRWYQNGTPLYGYYRNHPRTAENLLEYAKSKLALSAK